MSRSTRNAAPPALLEPIPGSMPIQEQDAGATLRLLQLAIERGVPVETLERLQALHERVEARAAAQALAAALARFQAACPPIAKTSTAHAMSRKTGTSWSYRYAELDEIARTIAPHLRDAGLSYTWDSQIRDGLLTCICTLRHLGGHQAQASFALPIDNDSGMNAQQKHAAALTYARRQSLIQVLGLTTCEPDTDAANPTPITEQQAADLAALIEEVGVDRERFLRWAKVGRLEEILARDYEACVNVLRARAGRGDRLR